MPKDTCATYMKATKNEAIWEGCLDCGFNKKCDCFITISGRKTGKTPHTPAMAKRFEEFILRSCPYCEQAIIRIYKQNIENENKKR